MNTMRFSRMTGLILLIAFLFTGCDSLTNPPKDLDPVSLPQHSYTYTPRIQYLSQDSVVSVDPRLFLFRKGSDTQGRLRMDLEIEVRVDNPTHRELVVEAERVSLYNYQSAALVSTVRLDPTGTTLTEHSISADSFVILRYVNNPIDGEILYYPYESEFVAAFILTVNGEEHIFATHIANPA